MLDVDKIRQLIEMMVTNDLVEVSLRDGDVEVNLRRPNSQTPGGAAMAHAAAGRGNPVQVLDLPTNVSGPADTAPSMEESIQFLEIKSPMVGTFYASPDPDSPPFVTVGSEVHPGTVTCVLEAMKVYNEIKAEVAGRIERILVKDAQPVEFGQPLFLVRPL